MIKAVFQAHGVDESGRVVLKRQLRRDELIPFFEQQPRCVPRQHSTGGQVRLGRITKAGNAEIRKLLVLGATSMVRRATHWNSRAGLWVQGVLARRPVRLVTVALVNKMARIAPLAPSGASPCGNGSAAGRWALMTRAEVYRAQGRALATAEAAA